MKGLFITFAGKMMDEYGLSGYEIHPFGRTLDNGGLFHGTHRIH